MSLADDSTMVRPVERHMRLDASHLSAARAIPVGTDEPAAAAAKLAQLASSNFAVAITAVQRGAEEIEQLHGKCAKLRAELSDAEGRQREQLLALQKEILHWQDMVCDLADRYQDNQAQLQASLVQQSLMQETAVRDQKRAETAERRSLSFERLVLGLHDQILSAIVKDRCDTAEPAATSLSAT